MQFLLGQSIAKAVEFYTGATHVGGLDDSFGRAVAGKGGLRCKRIMLGNELRRLELLPEHIQSFLKKYGEVYILPIEDVSAIRALFFRACLQKDFRVVPDGKPFLYGMHRFGNFKYGDLVILSEGIKDAEAIARYHRYSLSVLGSHVSVTQAAILQSLTDRYIFIADSDDTGRKVERFNIKAGCKSVFYVNGAKDPGEAWDRDIGLEDVVKGIKLAYERRV